MIFPPSDKIKLSKRLKNLQKTRNLIKYSNNRKVKMAEIVPFQSRPAGPGRNSTSRNRRHAGASHAQQVIACEYPNRLVHHFLSHDKFRNHGLIDISRLNNLASWRLDSIQRRKVCSHQTVRANTRVLVL